jgi:hypothetical protein
MRKMQPKDAAVKMVMDFMADVPTFKDAQAVAKRAAYMIGMEINDATQATNDADYWNAVIHEIGQIRLT